MIKNPPWNNMYDSEENLEYFNNRDKFDTSSPLLEATVHTLSNEFHKPIKIRHNGEQYIAKISEISGPTYDDDSYLEYYIVDSSLNNIFQRVADQGCVLPESVHRQTFEELVSKKECLPEPSELRGKEFKLNYALSYEDSEVSNVSYHKDITTLLNEAKASGAFSAVSGNSVNISIGSIDIYSTNTSHEGFDRAGDLINYKHSVDPTEFGKTYIDLLKKKQAISFDLI